MKLSDFPPEILQEILNGPHRSPLVVELWKTGDRVLMSTLVNKGVTDMNLRCRNAHSTSRWPKCLKHFKLERLAFRMASSVYTTNVFRQELEQLHSGLKYLQIYATNVLDAMFPPSKSTNSVPADDEPLPSKRPKTQDSDQATPHHTLWDLNHTWPSLEHLELGHGQHFSTPSSWDDPRTLALMPRNLTFLGLPDSQLRPVLELMPPNLTTFRVWPQSLLPEDLRQLPKTITDLHHSVSDDGLLLLSRDRDLFPHYSYPPLHARATDFLRPILEGTLTWPHTIKELTGDSSQRDFGSGAFVCTAALKPLPSNWRFNNSIKPAYVTPASLPRGLTSLSVADIEWNDIDVSTWPSTLTTLSVTESSHTFNIGCLHLLPRQLKHCTIVKDDYKPSLQPFIPSYDLDTLCDIGQRSLATDPLWPSMKQEILTHRSSSVPLEALESYLKSIESGQLFGLPLALTSLQMPILATTKLLLPPRVSNLVQVQYREEADYSPFCTLLLESLPPTTSAHFEMLGAYGVAVKPCQATALHDALSISRLTSITIDDPNLQVGKDLFQNLPRTLTFLSLSSSPKPGIDPERLQLLPNLKGLELQANILENVFDSWVQYLPRTLETLRAPRMLIVGHHIKDLPPNLNSLCSSFFEVSLPQVLHFPRTLSFLQQNRCGGHDTTSLHHCLTDRAWDWLVFTYSPFWRIWEAGLHGMTVELSITAGRRKARNVWHLGAAHMAKTLDKPLPNGFKWASSTEGENYDYTSANVTRYLQLEDDRRGAHPSTSRRVCGYV